MVYEGVVYDTVLLIRFIHHVAAQGVVDVENRRERILLSCVEWWHWDRFYHPDISISKASIFPSVMSRLYLKRSWVFGSSLLQSYIDSCVEGL